MPEPKTPFEAPCGRCGGTGHVVCPHCNGDGCFALIGDGYLAEASGTPVPVNLCGGQERCSACEGTGTKRSR